MTERTDQGDAIITTGRSSLEPTEPLLIDRDADTEPLGPLYEVLARAVATRPWWRRWPATALATLRSWQRRGSATLAGSSWLRHRRPLTMAVAGTAAVTLATIGIVVSIQENWLTRVGSALDIGDSPADDAAAREPLEPPPAEAPADPVERAAGDEDDTRLVATDDAPRISEVQPPAEEVQERSRRSQQRETRSQEDAEPAEDAQPAADPAPEPEPAAEQPARAPEPAPKPAAKPKPAPKPPDRLGTGGKLGPGGKLRSSNGKYTLVMQEDGNLVLYGPSRALWSTGTHGNPGAYLVNQTDSNIVVYGPSRALWSTGTHPYSAYGVSVVLVVQDDGNLVAYQSGFGDPKKAVWASNTVQ